MILEITIGIIGTIVILSGIGMLIQIRRWKQLEEKILKPLVHLPVQPAPQVNVNMRPMEELIKGLPNKVLHSIQSSVNTKKGALGELIGYIELEARYDRIIPLGNIVDFLAISFPKEEKPGKIVFIDVKTGKSARLSKDQRMVKQLIEDKQIEFMKLTITESFPGGKSKNE